MAELKDNDYYVTLGPVYKKPGEDPATQKILKLNRKVGDIVHTTGKVWKAPAGGFWVELDISSGDSGAGGKPGYVMIDANGFGTPGPCLQKAAKEDGPPVLLKAACPEGEKPWDGDAGEKVFLVLQKTQIWEVRVVLSMLFGLKKDLVKIKGGPKDDASIKDLGLETGAQLEFEYSDGKPMNLYCNSPVESFEGKLCDLPIKDNWTVGQVAGLIAQITGLKQKSMILAKGKMGERVPESAKMDEGKQIVSYGYADGDEVAFMYLGELETDLAKYLETKK